MNVLHVSPSFYPATQLGGPIWSTLELCNSLVELPQISVRVASTDMGCEKVHRHIDNHRLRAFEPLDYDVKYAHCLFGRDIAPALIITLLQEIRQADIVHLTGVYSFPTLPTLFLARATRKPVLWSPRGALLASSIWKSTAHPRKKRAWEAVCSRLSSKARTVLHVTSQAELAASLRRMPKFQAVMIPNGVAFPQNNAPSNRRRTSQRCEDKPLKTLFIGRLHPIKALENLILALSLLPRKSATLSILGKGEFAYQRELADLVVRLGLTSSVRFYGHVESDAKQKFLAEADVCVLPSHSENFGMVVAEALASGTPVIASRGVPWPELDARNCGIWTESNKPEALAAAMLDIRRCDRETMGQNGRRWMESEFNWGQISKKFVSVYETMLSRTTSNDLPFVKIGDLN